MSQWLFWLIFAPVFGAAMYGLYCQGIAVSKSIAAVLFVFRPGNGGDRVTVGSCSGWVCHVGRFREHRIYEFVLDARLTQGDAEVLLLDRKKQQVLRLDKQFPAASVELDGNSRYYLRWEFKSATGECELYW